MAMVLWLWSYGYGNKTMVLLPYMIKKRWGQLPFFNITDHVARNTSQSIMQKHQAFFLKSIMQKHPAFY